MKEEELTALGFVKTDQYKHDRFDTNRYTKGLLQVEFTYDGSELIVCDLTIEEVNCMPITLDEIKALTPILGNRTE